MAFVQGNIVTSGGTVNSCPFSTNNTAGNLLLVAVQSFNVPGSVSDSQGNTYTQLGSYNNSTDYTTVWYALNCLAGANTVSLSGSNVLEIAILEYSAIPTSSAVDAWTEVSGSSTASVTTTQASDLLILVTGAVSTGSYPPTPSGSYTLREGAQVTAGGTPRWLDVFDATAGTIGPQSTSVTNAVSTTATFLIAFKSVALSSSAQLMQFILM